MQLDAVLSIRFVLGGCSGAAPVSVTPNTCVTPNNLFLERQILKTANILDIQCMCYWQLC